MQKFRFFVGKQTLEAWSFKIDRKNKVLEIKTRADRDGATKFVKIVDTSGGHYGVILETRKRTSSSILFTEDDSGVLLVEAEKKDLCFFKSVRKVHEVNRHKGKEQLMATYRNAGWMSPEMVNVIIRVIDHLLNPLLSSP